MGFGSFSVLGGGFASHALILLQLVAALNFISTCLTKTTLQDTEQEHEVRATLSEASRNFKHLNPSNRHIHAPKPLKACFFCSEVFRERVGFVVLCIIGAYCSMRLRVFRLSGRAG